MMLERQKFSRPLDNESHINPQVPGSSPGRGANSISSMRAIPAIGSTRAVCKNPRAARISQSSSALTFNNLHSSWQWRGIRAVATTQAISRATSNNNWVAEESIKK
jgi:hypothetical protein